MKVEEIKTYRCSDGAVFDSKDVAEAHEADLKDPNYLLIKRIEELEKKVQHLEAENLKRIAEIECVKSPFGQINKKDPYQRNWWEDQKWPNIQYFSEHGKPHPDVGPIVSFQNNPKNTIFYGEGETIEDAINNLQEVKSDDR